MLMRSPLARDRRRPEGFIPPALLRPATKVPTGPEWIHERSVIDMDLAHGHKVPVIVDPKVAHISRYKGATVSTPNHLEAVQAAGLHGDDEAILLEAGVSNIIGCDSRGALHTKRADYLDGSMPPIKRWFAEATNPERRDGAPAEVIDGVDLFIGVSGAKVLPAEALTRMNATALAERLS